MTTTVLQIVQLFLFNLNGFDANYCCAAMAWNILDPAQRMMYLSDILFAYIPLEYLSKFHRDHVLRWMPYLKFGYYRILGFFILYIAMVIIKWTIRLSDLSWKKNWERSTSESNDYYPPILFF